MPAKRRATKVVEPVEEVEELEIDEEDDDLDDLTEEVEEEPAPPKRKVKAKAPQRGSTPQAPKAEPKERPRAGSGYDSNWLAEFVETATGDAMDSRQIRMIIRKLAKDDNYPQVEREVGEDRSRYDFPKQGADPVVKAVLAYVKSGAAKADKSDGLAAARAAKAKKNAPAAPVKQKVTKSKTVVEVEDDDDDTPAPKVTKVKRRRATASA